MFLKVLEKVYPHGVYKRIYESVIMALVRKRVLKETK